MTTELIAAVYGQDEDLETHARTGCVGCNLASRDFAPLMELRPFYAELKKPHNRIRKDGSETRKDGSLVSNPCRMGPLTFEARHWGLDQIKSIQTRAGVDLINSEEEARIIELIEAQTWPRGWDGSEPVASDPFENVYPDGSVQKNLSLTMSSQTHKTTSLWNNLFHSSHQHLNKNQIRHLPSVTFFPE